MYATIVGFPVVPDEPWMRRRLLARDGKHPERVRVAEVVLAREREPREVVERAEVAGLDVGEALAVQRDTLLHPSHERSEPLELERRELLPRHGFEHRLEDHPRSIARRMR